MPDDPQNPISTENPSPASPQEPTEPASENTAQSKPSEANSEPQTAQGEVFEPKVESEQLPQNQGIELNEPELEPSPEPSPETTTSTVEPEIKAESSQTGQIPVNDPLSTSAKSSDEAQEEPETQKPEPKKEEEEKPKVSYLKSQKWNELLVMARNAIQFRKRKKLDRVMTLFLKYSKITNDEVEKLLHVSDKTAERYLNILEKENKIRQVGKTGKSVHYVKI